MIKIYTDGGSRGNPGEAAIGYVILDNDITIFEHGSCIGVQTNNFAEYTAVLSALKKARDLQISDVELYLDSQLVEKQIRGEYKVNSKELMTLYLQVKEEISKFSSFKIEHIKRNLNKRADYLVNLALDESKVIENISANLTEDKNFIDDINILSKNFNIDYSLKYIGDNLVFFIQDDILTDFTLVYKQIKLILEQNNIEKFLIEVTTK